jgi:hypothetical protein
MNYNDENLLEMVELYAEEMGYISSEEELSEVFDEEILPYIVKEYGEDDEPAINEGFNSWSDSLCEDGVTHPIQYDQYCYVGKLS